MSEKTNTELLHLAPLSRRPRFRRKGDRGNTAHVSSTSARSSLQPLPRQSAPWAPLAPGNGETRAKHGPSTTRCGRCRLPVAGAPPGPQHLLSRPPPPTCRAQRAGPGPDGPGSGAASGCPTVGPRPQLPRARQRQAGPTSAFPRSRNTPQDAARPRSAPGPAPPPAPLRPRSAPGPAPPPVAAGRVSPRRGGVWSGPSWSSAGAVGTKRPLRCCGGSRCGGSAGAARAAFNPASRSGRSVRAKQR